MSRNSNDESFAILMMIALAIFLAWVYFQIKAFAVWTHLDMYAAGYLLLGGVAVAAVIVVSLWQGWSLSKILPGIPFLFVWFLIPALNYWSVDHEGGYVLSSPEWYGLFWGQAAIVLGCAGFGFGVYKTVNDY